MVLVLVLTLGILGAIQVIVVPKVASSLASTIRSRILVPLHLGSQIVGGLLAALVLKDWLREGGGRGRVYPGIAGSIVAVITISSRSRKIQMKTIVGVHDGRNRTARALDARGRVSSSRDAVNTRCCYISSAIAYEWRDNWGVGSPSTYLHQPRITDCTTPEYVGEMKSTKII